MLHPAAQTPGDDADLVDTAVVLADEGPAAVVLAGTAPGRSGAQVGARVVLVVTDLGADGMRLDDDVRLAEAVGENEWLLLPGGAPPQEGDGASR
ncbi:hypothetical protein AUCHE_24_00400 [Austwickia chelonae NBRC 105200]|uniref:Uncharacterized protein n=1 Tax=Austwickia chelonae NBRC 105200 TaxID=1184607 RepID=K6VVL7_9MICO|nr:hypothetical protein AUCHE_24_00400 [Austwickia chelonae NBRC 105200]